MVFAFARDEGECGKVREHVDERKWPELGRGYSDGSYERSKLGSLEKKIAKIRDSIAAVKEDMMSENNGGAAWAKLAAGEGKVA